jgi:hypothetical protein
LYYFQNYQRKDYHRKGYQRKGCHGDVFYQDHPTMTLTNYLFHNEWYRNAVSDMKIVKKCEVKKFKASPSSLPFKGVLHTVAPRWVYHAKVLVGFMLLNI